MPTLPDLTWPMLLAKWTEFARASVAFPTTGEGGRWRDAVAPIIGLQAIACALGESHQLARSERALAHDRAEVLMRRYAAQLNALWHGEPLPEKLFELTADARRALTISRSRGVEWLAADGGFTAPADGTFPAALGPEVAEGELLLLTPGEHLEDGHPVAFIRDRFGGPPDAATLSAIAAYLAGGAGAVSGPHPVAGARQVYRQADPSTPDLVMPLEDGLPAGRPLLRPIPVHS